MESQEFRRAPDINVPADPAPPFTLLRWDVRSTASAPDASPPTLRISANAVRVESPDFEVEIAYAAAPGLVADLPDGEWVGVRESLDAVPDHRDPGSGLTRFAFRGPVIASIHLVHDAASLAPGYCDPHRHPDSAELNVLLPGADGLAYNVLEGAWDTRIAPALIWTPPGREHAATASAGAGVFLMLRVPSAP